MNYIYTEHKPIGPILQLLALESEDLRTLLKCFKDREENIVRLVQVTELRKKSNISPHKCPLQASLGNVYKNDEYQERIENNIISKYQQSIVSDQQQKR